MGSGGAEPETKICERRVLYCVPLPGESAWVRQLDGGGAGAPPLTPEATEGPSSGQKSKRGRDVGGDVDMDAEAGEAGGSSQDAFNDVSAAAAPAADEEDADDVAAVAAAVEGVKRRSAVEVEGGGAPITVVADESLEDTLNLPLGGGGGGGGGGSGGGGGGGTGSGGAVSASPCIVKLYDDEDSLKLNDVVGQRCIMDDARRRVIPCLILIYSTT